MEIYFLHQASHQVITKMRNDIILLKTVINVESRKSLRIKTKNLQLNSFKVQCLDCMFGVLALINLLFSQQKKSRETNNAAFCLVLEKKFKNS